MGRSIPESLIAEARALLAEGLLSHREIAKATGISRGTIRLLNSGKRKDPKPRKKQLFRITPEGPIEWCTGCSAYVHTPCRLCILRHGKPSPTKPKADWKHAHRTDAYEPTVHAVPSAGPRTSGNVRARAA